MAMLTPRGAKTSSVIYTDTESIASATAESDALVLGTVANWMDVTGWNAGPRPLDARIPDPASSVKEFSLEITCDATETLTSPQLFGVRALPVTIDDDDVDTVDSSNNELDITSHAYQTGDGPVRLTTSDTLPAGLALGTDYWVRDIGTGTIQLHTSRAGAIADTGQVAFTDGGTGTHTVVDVQGSANSDDDTKRLHFLLYGDINAGSTITVGAQQGYIERIQHDPLTLYYEVVATSGTGAQTLVMRACPVQMVEW